MEFQPAERSHSRRFPEAESPLPVPRRGMNMRSLNLFDCSRGFSGVWSAGNDQEQEKWSDLLDS